MSGTGASARPGLPVEGQDKSGERPYKPDWKAALDAQEAPRCRARCRRSKLPGRGPAMRDKVVCRLHGGKRGGPMGLRNGASRTGRSTAEAKAERQAARARGCWPRPTEGFSSNARVGNREKSALGLPREPMNSSPLLRYRSGLHRISSVSSRVGFPWRGHWGRNVAASVVRWTENHSLGAVAVPSGCSIGAVAVRESATSVHLSTRQAEFATFHRCCSGDPI